MAEVDPNKVIQKLAMRIANDAIQLAFAQAAAENAAETQVKTPVADNASAEGI
jgi:hypothetical protein